MLLNKQIDRQNVLLSVIWNPLRITINLSQIRTLSRPIKREKVCLMCPDILFIIRNIVAVGTLIYLFYLFIYLVNNKIIFNVPVTWNLRGNNNLPIADNDQFLIVPFFKINYNNIKNMITVWFLSLYLQKNHQCTN